MNRISQIQDFLKESPNESFLLHALALEYIKIGNDEEARKYFELNKKLSPNYVATYYHLGKLLERSHDIEAAIRMYEEGMKVAKAAGDQHAFNELRSVHEELLY